MTMTIMVMVMVMMKISFSSCSSCRPYGQYDYSYPPSGMPAQQQTFSPQIFQPTQTFTPSSSHSMYGSSFDDEPPLLEGE